nr:YfhO family protein [uncultured Acetatifactor sp.]
MKGIIRQYYRDEKLRQATALILSFVLPVTIVLCLFVIRGIYPFGDRSFLFSDMYHQYMPFFSEFLHKVRAGEGIAYSFNVGIGSNFLALYVYYLASPLHFLAFLLPEAYLMEFMSYLAVIKIGLCGLTSFWYLQRHFATKDGAVLFFSCFYALSGYMAAYNWNIMWLDCIVLLPLIILGLERLVKEGKCGMYCVTLSLSILTNYYISIMICIFLVLYFLALLLTEKRSLRIVGNFVLYSLLAGGMAALLLVPEVCAILETDFGDMNFPETLTSYFSVLDMLARHCMSVTTERGLEHWPNLYCGTAVFMLLPMYALNQKISIRKRFANLALAGVFLLSFSTNMLDFIWHGMNYPDSLPARQSFIYILLILTMCYEAYKRVDEIEEKQILYGYLAAAAFLLCCEKFIVSEDFDIGIEILTLTFVTIYAVLIYLHRTRKNLRWKQILAAAALVAVVAEASVNFSNTSLGTVSRSAYLGQQEDYKALYKLTGEREDGFYRLEKFTRKTKNDGTLTGYPTASVFSSTMNSSVMDMYKRLGMRHSKVYYCFDGATLFTSALLNVKYMFGESNKYENEAYTLLEKSGDIFLYECVYDLPFGYVAPKGYDLPEGYLGQGIRLQNQMVWDLGIEGELFTEGAVQESGDDVRITADRAGFYYAILTASGTSKVDLIGGSLETHTFSDLKDGSILYLGYLQKGDAVTLTNADDGDETQKIFADAYVCDTQVLQQALEALSESHLEQVEYDSRNISGRLTLEHAGRLILSVPYEDGWSVLINGEEAEPALFGGTLMAFDLEEGEYTIELSYTPEGAWAGLGVSVVSICIFGIILLAGRRKKGIKRRVGERKRAGQM